MITKFRIQFVGLSMVLVASVGCQTSINTRPVADLPPGVAGIWQSNGYGYVLDATGEYPRLFHHTSEFCIADEENAAVLSHYLIPENLAYGNQGRSLYFQQHEKTTQ